MRNYDDRQADWNKKQDDKAAEEQQRAVKLGVVRGKATRDIKQTDDVTVKIDHVETLKFKPSVEVKKGDSIRITIEKV